MLNIVFGAILLFIVCLLCATIAIKEIGGYLFSYNQIPNPSPNKDSSLGWVDVDGDWPNVAGSTSQTRAVFSTPLAAKTFCDANAKCLGIIDNSRGSGDATNTGYIAFQQVPALTHGWSGTVAYSKYNASTVTFPAVYKYFY